ERAVPVGHLAGAAGVVDRRLDLAAMTHDADIGQQPGDVAFVEARHRAVVEAGEGGPEVLALLQDGSPAQARLEAFETDLLEQAPVVADGEAPFGVVVAEIVGRGEAPAAAVPAVRAGQDEADAAMLRGRLAAWRSVGRCG